MKEESGWSRKEAERRMAEIREEIDAVDADLVRLLNARAALSLEVGRIKAGAGDLVFKPSREKELLERLIIENPGPLPEKQLRSIYREILSSSRRLQRPQRVAYLGPEGTFSYFAGVEFLGHSADFVSKHGLEEVFRAVSGAETELGIIPLENSLHGTVGQSLDLFLSHEVFIQSEIFCKISQSVIGRAESLTEIGTIYSHPQPLAQCARWISTHLPEAVVVTTESTAAAASRAARDKNSVSIGHKGLAQLFGLNVLATGVEDLAENWTRFVVIARSETVGGTREKTSLLFSLPDEPGSLVSVLGLLSEREVNMKKLESRPMRGETWKYVFFVDVECDLESPDYADLRGLLRERCHVLRILGSYPAGPYLDVSEADPGPRATGGKP
jgi:chorismate mutase/prephenate dehydratase